MAKPYSVDLRERVVSAVEAGGLSRNAAALRFGVAISTAIRWVRRFRETGSVAPGRMGGRRPKAIGDAHRAWLLQRTREQDFTLRGLVAELAARGLEVDYRTMWNFVHAEKLSVKKNRARQRAGSSRRGAPARPVEQVSGPHPG
jgi:putative transposase